MALAALIPTAAHAYSPAFVSQEASRFGPSEIREAIARWVANDRLDLADALVASGLSQYPDNEHILALAALVAEVQQDWVLAQERLEALLRVQGEGASPETLHHLIRVLRCRGVHTKAYLQAQQAAARFPSHAGLVQAHAELTELLASVPLTPDETGLAP